MMIGLMGEEKVDGYGSITRGGTISDLNKEKSQNTRGEKGKDRNITRKEERKKKGVDGATVCLEFIIRGV